MVGSLQHCTILRCPCSDLHQRGAHNHTLCTQDLARERTLAGEHNGADPPPQFPRHAEPRRAPLLVPVGYACHACSLAPDRNPNGSLERRNGHLRQAAAARFAAGTTSV